MEEKDLGLYYYVSRWYDPSLGRFIQGDTLIPSAMDPKSYDRYSYVENNPIRYSDPTGHYGCRPGLDGGKCGNRGSYPTPDNEVAKYNYNEARDFYQNNPSYVGDKLKELGEIFGNVLGIVNEPIDTIMTVEEIATYGFEWYHILSFAPLISNGISREVAQRVPKFVRGFLNKIDNIGDVWSLPPFIRGYIIEAYLGGSCNNRAVIDKFVDGVATSIKSLDLNANTYQTLGNLKRTVTGYIDEIADFTGNTYGKNDTIYEYMIQGRELVLAIPLASNKQQAAILSELGEYAQSLDVDLVIEIIQ